MTGPKQYPYEDGDVTVLGPEIFVSADGQTISWRGENYVPQASVAKETDAPGLIGPALTYATSTGWRNSYVMRVDVEAPTDPRERALCRALPHHALALLDASEQPRKVTLGGEGRRL